MNDVRCGKCKGLLFKAADNAIVGPVEAKCRKCGTINHLRAVPSSSPERRERQVVEGQSHGDQEEKAPNY